MRIIQIENDEEKHITRNILEALPDWFGIPKREKNIYMIV